MLIPPAAVFILGMTLSDPTTLFRQGNAVMAFAFVVAIGGAWVVGCLVGLFPWWMAAFDSEKRALHDRISATRVVRK